MTTTKHRFARLREGRPAAWGAVLACIAGWLLGGTGQVRADATLKIDEHSIALPGLAEPVEILRDRWGIAHIYARNEADLFFAQGYNAAHDRLFQLELWRLQASGTAAEVLGRRELKRDIGARLHQFRGDLNQELSFYHPRGVKIVESFVAGINAYIDEVSGDPARLPVEFGLLGIRPRHWTPAIVISRHQGLLDNIGEEVALARAISKFGVDRVKQVLYFQGGQPVLTPDPALDLAAIPDKVLEMYDAFRSSLRFVPEQIAVTARNDRASHERLARANAEADQLLLARSKDVGSNNWVVHGSRTQSSYPLLANDPHRALGAPSLRYWVHLVAPGWNVIGAGEPSLPGVSIGHNEQGAWGLTIFGNDSEDLYVYETHPEDPNQYRHQGKWQQMRLIKDRIQVKGEQPVEVTYKYTRHGPVLFEDITRHKAYALRAAWMEIGGAPYLASLRMNQAGTWEEFREALTFNHIPAENMVWADRKGNIGYQAAGIQPLRKNWSGLLPVPGDGRYEWNGYLPIKELPNALNPARGFIVTANHFLMPIDYAHPDAMHFIWADPYRAARITEVIGSGKMFSVGEIARLQNDDLSIPARSLVPLLEGVPLQGAAAQAAASLQSWDFVLRKDSAPAAVYEMWQRTLLTNVRALFLPKDEAWPRMSLKRTIDHLLAPGGAFGSDPTAGRDALLRRSLEEAVAELSKRFGADQRTWRYGDPAFHHALIRHPLSEAVKDSVRAQLDVGPAPRGGDAFTVSATGGADNQASGGSFKLIVDTEDWDNSIGLNIPGQSGDPSSAHYRDLFALWAEGKYFPAAYSRSKVESVAAQRTVLQPRAN